MLTLLLFFVCSQLTIAQTARLQVIHNSPTPTVDVYANDDLLLDDFEFRTATPFIDVAADVQITLGVALDNSTMASDAIATFPVTFEDGKTYVVVANGIVGNQDTPFNLEIFDMGREAAPSTDEVSLLFFHGSPDAPEVDVVTGGSPIFDDVSFSEFSGYIDVPAASYQLDVTPGNDNSTIVASYTADLSGLGGGAAVVFASGFLSGDDPAFAPWVALPDGNTFALPVAPMVTGTARVQVIHNSPTPNVDIYANDDLLLDNFVFRTATPFIDVPAGVNISLGVATANSTSAADAIANFDVMFEDGKTYIVIANGVVGGNPGFDLDVFDMGFENSNDPANVALLFAHGSPDAPDVDILANGNVLFNDVAFGTFDGYTNVPAASYTLDVTPANDNNTVVARYQADFDFWKGNSAVIFASGFLGGDDPAFQPWVALSNGGTYPLTQVTIPDNSPKAKVQVIHNSPTPTVDVYANNDLLLDNFAFRTATPFLDVPAGVQIDLGIALANSSSATDAIANFPVTLEEGRSYVVVANGIVGNADTPFNLEIFDMGSETADADDNVGILFFHGSPDAPEVDIVTGGTPIFDDVSFGEFSGYINVPANSDYELAVTPANDNSTVVETYLANFSFWKGRTAVVFASGFLSGDNPAFEPWVALSNGGTFPLPVAHMKVAPVNVDLSTFGGVQDLSVFPNPALGYTNVTFSLPTASPVQLNVISVNGQLMKTMQYSELVEGNHLIELDFINQLTAGQYFIRLETNDSVLTKSLFVE